MSVALARPIRNMAYVVVLLLATVICDAACANQIAIIAAKLVRDARQRTVAAIDQYIAFFKSKPWHTFVGDTLAENGYISFHRYQIAI